MSEVCRWGILGAATIARKNWQAILNSGNSRLVAVGSRSPERAEQFIAECQQHVPHPIRPRACSYEALLADREIDAVYIPLPTGLRKEWVIRAAEAGKHVLCEKPCAVNAKDLHDMIAACERNNVQFMDGVMFMHSARLNAIRSALDDSTSVGDVRRITSQFSFCAPEEFFRDNIRASRDLEPMGCLGDLGWYTTRFTLWAMKYEMPSRVSGRMLEANSAGVPLQFSAEMFFPSGTTAGFYCSFKTENQEWANVSGSKGFLHVPDFVLGFFGSELGFTVTNAHFSVQGCNFSMEGRTRRVAVNEYSNNMPNAQETHLFRNFSQLVIEKRRDPHWPKIALQTQRLLDAFLVSAGRDGEVISVSDIG